MALKCSIRDCKRAPPGASSGRIPDLLLLEIKAIAEKLTSENWKASREVILAALNPQVLEVAADAADAMRDLVATKPRKTRVRKLRRL